MAKRADGAPDLDRRLGCLEQAVQAGEDRVSSRALDAASAVVERAGHRRQLSADHTVVGFFGATGSGKSSLFNAIVGVELARAAATRPTTSQAMAAIFEHAGAQASDAGELLDWLQVRERHVIEDAEGAGRSTRKTSGLGGLARWWRGESSPPAGGLILLDLPDFDSTAREHREVVERLAGQVDVLVFVLDPQKYADAVVHQDFLRSLAGHEAVTLVVLNQTDRLREDEVQPVLASLTELLGTDGLQRRRVRAVSAVTGLGVDALREDIRRIVDQRSAAQQRLLADAQGASELLAADAAPRDLAVPSQAERERLSASLGEAAGVGTVVRAAQRSYRLDATAYTGWPLTKWLAKLRPDPLRRLNLKSRDVNPDVNRTSLPAMGPAQRAMADGAVRRFAEAASEGAPESWRNAIADAAIAGRDDLPGNLDRAIAGTDISANRRSWWWFLIGTIQWVALATALGGALWLLGLATASYFQFELPPAPKVEGFPIPTLMVLAGLLAGVVLAVLSSAIARAGAAMRGATVRRRLLASISAVAQERVVAPVEAEIERCNSFRAAVTCAGGGRST